MKRTRIVKLIAIDNRYKDTPYPYKCIKDDSLGTFLTGQHIDPSDPETEDNLTLDEMTNKVPLSQDKVRRFPFVINPLRTIKFMNNQKFDLSTNSKGEIINYKDEAFVNLLRKYGWFVAQDKDSIIPRKHYFYIHDEIHEAEKRIVSSDKAYQAEKYVREDVSEEGLKDLALVLSYKLASFSYTPGVTNKLVIKDKIIEACKNNPEKVLETKEESFKDDLFILKLSLNDILRRRGTDFYYGSEFIGKDLNAVKKYMKMEENRDKVSKWSRTLAEKEDRPIGDMLKDAPDERTKKASERYDEIKDMNLEELRKYAGGVRKYRKNEWELIDDIDEFQKYLLSKV